MKRIIIFALLIALLSCNQQEIEISKVHTSRQINQKGIATWYGPGFNNHRTSSGQNYDMYSYTAAHLTLPLGTIIRVTNIDNKRSTVVRVNDRGPVNTKLILDLSKVAASNIDLIRSGSAKVELEVLSVSTNPLEKIFEVYRRLASD